MIINPYLEEIKMTLPRILSSVNTNQLSVNYGSADRTYWAWKTKDFANATSQGYMNGLARLWVNGLWPYPSETSYFFERIDAMFANLQRITRKNGSLEEAFPRESSWCVTALGAFDATSTARLLAHTQSAEKKRRWLTCIEPLIDFLMTNKEKHAFISNHLLTGAAALSEWAKLTNDSDARIRSESLIERVLSRQNADGGFLEYSGVDPGYQTLSLQYLASVYSSDSHPRITASIRNALEFSKYFVHPDGSFGGSYGSRNTRIFYPGGIELLCNNFEDAESILSVTRKSISDRKFPTLNSIDNGNLAPVFNSYCTAAVAFNGVRNSPSPSLPCEKVEEFSVHMKESGLYIHNTPDAYSIVALNKGGILYSFDRNGKCIIDLGLVAQDAKGRRYTTQLQEPPILLKIEANTLTINSYFNRVKEYQLSPQKMILLRLATLTFFRNHLLVEAAKRFIVRIMILRRNSRFAENSREITFGMIPTILDRPKIRKGTKILDEIVVYFSIHMASQGYWQLSDESWSRG